MVKFGQFLRNSQPFTHWVALDFIDADLLRWINADWPSIGDEWMVEDRGYAKKRALMFPRRLHIPAQALARHLYSEPALDKLSEITGIELLPDPWFEEGPLRPSVGGGLHEIETGGMLGIHTDFTIHPSGVYRRLNLLIYLNEEWRPEWGGQLELAGDRGRTYICPMGGTAVAFECNDKSWHGHPEPLRCPQDKTRRSLALYYYAKEPASGAIQKSTVYRRAA